MLTDLLGKVNHWFEPKPPLRSIQGPDFDLLDHMLLDDKWPYG